jgi:hypothetical protein
MFFAVRAVAAADITRSSSKPMLTLVYLMLRAGRPESTYDNIPATWSPKACFSDPENGSQGFQRLS